MTGHDATHSADAAIPPPAEESTSSLRVVPRSVMGAALAIGGLIALAVLVVIISAGRQAAFPADSPEATVQGYLLAFADTDDAGAAQADAAYGYLSAEVQAEMTLNQYRRMVRDQYYGDESRRITLDRVEVSGDRADVYLAVHYGGAGGLFGGGGSSSHEVAIPLVREPGGWRIDRPMVGIDEVYLERYEMFEEIE